MQELYSGGKDCNILAWVPVLRSPDVEVESNTADKVKKKDSRSSSGMKEHDYIS